MIQFSVDTCSSALTKACKIANAWKNRRWLFSQKYAHKKHAEMLNYRYGKSNVSKTTHRKWKKNHSRYTALPFIRRLAHCIEFLLDKRRSSTLLYSEPETLAIASFIRALTITRRLLPPSLPLSPLLSLQLGFCTRSHLEMLKQSRTWMNTASQWTAEDVGPTHCSYELADDNSYGSDLRHGSVARNGGITTGRRQNMGPVGRLRKTHRKQITRHLNNIIHVLHGCKTWFLHSKENTDSWW